MTTDFSRLDALQTLEPTTGRQEVRALFEALGGIASAYNPLRQNAKPNGQVSSEVILLPGFGATHHLMFLTRNRLQKLGCMVDDWGLGLNDGNVPRLLQRFVEQLQIRQAQGKPPAILLGWSLGGYIAREAAREVPDAVKHIFTLGTPVVGGPRFTRAATLYKKRGWSLDAIDRETRERFQQPLKTPVTALYTRKDGVVNWEVCLDHWSPHVRHIEVDSSHVGMPFSNQVLKLLDDLVREVA